MTLYRKIDSNGYFVEDVLLDAFPVMEDGTPNPYYIDKICPEGLYCPRWTGTEWVEGLTQEEIDEILNATPQPTTEERINVLVNNVNDAMYAIMMLSIE